MKKERGSITIFSLISILLITTFLFTLLEGSRLGKLQQFANLQTENALVCAFANYNTSLWQNYRLLGTNKNQMSNVLEIAGNGQVGEGVNLLRLVPEEIIVTDETRITDAEGWVYISSVASYMKENLGYELTKEIYSRYQAMKEVLETNQMNLSNIEEALKEIETSSLQEETPYSKSIEKSDVEQRRNIKGILEAAKQWMELGVLQLVIEDTDQISKNKQDFRDGLLVRELEKGSKVYADASTWVEEILFQQYLLTYMSCYTKGMENRALSYELEYLLGEKEEDIDNLKVTVTKLLSIREASNFLYLISNTSKVAQAEAMALLCVGAISNPVLVEAVKIGLLTAWAFAESILDVRALLAGKKIAVLKSDTSWTSELEGVETILNGFPMAKESEWGLGYKDYLGILLLFEEEQQLAMRSMNLQEASIRKQDENPFFKMDMLITEAKAIITYSYEPIFPLWEVTNSKQRWKKRFSGSGTYGYYERQV